MMPKQRWDMAMKKVHDPNFNFGLFEDTGRDEAVKDMKETIDKSLASIQALQAKYEHIGGTDTAVTENIMDYILVIYHTIPREGRDF